MFNIAFEPEVKEQAEQVLDQLGIPMSNAVGMFLRQIYPYRSENREDNTSRCRIDGYVKSSTYLHTQPLKVRPFINQ